jgi:hypothetical protein
MMFACQFDNNFYALLLFEGICHSNSEHKSISNNELHPELVYRIELQRAGLRAGTKSVKRFISINKFFLTKLTCCGVASWG